MNENAKKAILAVVILLAIIAAGVGGKQFMAGDQPEFVGKPMVPEGHKSEKEIALEQQAAGAQPPGGREEKDLSGPIGSE